MLLNMRFSVEDLHSILLEINRVLKPKGFNFFSVRNQNDKSFGRGICIYVEEELEKVQEEPMTITQS